MSAPAASPFGKGLSFGLSAAPAAGTVGAPSFSMTPSMAPSGAQSTPFGGALAAPSPASPFPAFGQPTTASPAAPSAFGGFGQGASAATPGSSLFGQSTSASANAPSPFGGFGAPAGFGQSSSQSGPSQSFGGFGQAASIAPGIGNPATPGKQHYSCFVRGCGGMMLAQCKCSVTEASIPPVLYRTGHHPLPCRLWTGSLSSVWRTRNARVWVPWSGRLWRAYLPCSAFRGARVRQRLRQWLRSRGQPVW